MSLKIICQRKMLERNYGRAIHLNNIDDSNIQERIVRILEEMLRWTKVSSIPFVKSLLLESLPKTKDKLVFRNSDGIRTSREVGALSGIGKDAVIARWKKWAKIGIVEAIPFSNGIRGKSLFDLDNFGIDIPQNKLKIESVIQELPKGENGEENDE
jgi:hypothetical protein